MPKCLQSCLVSCIFALYASKQLTEFGVKRLGMMWGLIDTHHPVADNQNGTTSLNTKTLNIVTKRKNQNHFYRHKFALWSLPPLAKKGAVG